MIKLNKNDMIGYTQIFSSKNVINISENVS